MKKLLFASLTVLLSLAIFHSCNEPLTNEISDDEMALKSGAIEKQGYIVVLKDGEVDAEIDVIKGYEKRQEAMQAVSARILKRAGVLDGEVEHVYGTALKGFSVKIPPGQLKKLEDDPSVKYVEKDQVVTLIEPKGKPGGDVSINAETIPWGITRVQGGVIYTGFKKAWVIDTGIDLDHPDLNVNSSLSKTYVTRTTTANDDNGHGSHVAGTIAAIGGNGIGVVGVAAGAELVAVKVLDKRGSGYTSWVISGVDYVAAIAPSGDVANMSLGGGVSDALDTAVIEAADKGIKFALAAGNESDDANNHSPARANGDNIYTISAMDVNDNFAYFSNWGNPPVDYCEPGVSIYSTYKDGGYITYSGTSMAAPHMAGILMWGNPVISGYVLNDPDGDADRIGAAAQTVAPDYGTIAGNVKDNLNANLSGVLVTVEGISLSATTDASGNYTISNVPVGTYSVTASKVGYGSSTETNVGVTKNNNTIVNFTLSQTVTSQITLAATVSKVRGVRYVNLNWTGATPNTAIKIERNTAFLANDSSDNYGNGSYEDNLGRATGTFTYKVIEGSISSNVVTVVVE